jgi:hypothetical protein
VRMASTYVTVIGDGEEHVMTVQNNRSSLSLLAEHSNCRQNAVVALSSRWQQCLRRISARRRLEVLDLGTGDGDLLDRTLHTLGLSCNIYLVEPEYLLAKAAERLLSNRGHHVLRMCDSSAVGGIDAYLAAHVVFYLENPSDWFLGALGQLSITGILSCILRRPSCDCYQLRKVVRDHYGISTRMSAELFESLAAQRGFTSDSVGYDSTFSYPVGDPRIAVVPDESADRRLAQFICWIAGVPSDEKLPLSLCLAMNEFVELRHADGIFTLNQSDAVLSFS